ncbi:hypothetical protein HO173_009095 [Letharia columbiana]|uniref:Secreted protein n=1 Tax=Letharia columbiana TaxID=112416 RepID=A0A8H6L214_9LECA|nr:uncharacterized protein HO173_009095 [Letharia columbiana]KAF6232656.1 hypothetical protein HO173_009095 [Letharia columbiana]
MKSSILIGVAITGWMRALPSVAAQCSTIEDVSLTFYSWPDNGPPPGPDNTFDCGRGKGLEDGKPIAGVDWHVRRSYYFRNGHRQQEPPTMWHCLRSASTQVLPQ